MEGQPTPAVKEVKKERSVEEASKALFESMSKVVDAEVEIAVEDYATLQEMNALASERYADMRRQTVDLREAYDSMRVRHTQLDKYLAEIDTLDVNVGELERVTAHLDVYTKELEARFKSF